MNNYAMRIHNNKKTVEKQYFFAQSDKKTEVFFAHFVDIPYVVDNSECRHKPADESIRRLLERLLYAVDVFQGARGNIAVTLGLAASDFAVGRSYDAEVYVHGLEIASLAGGNVYPQRAY